MGEGGGEVGMTGEGEGRVRVKKRDWRDLGRGRVGLAGWGSGGRVNLDNWVVSNHQDY